MQEAPERTGRRRTTLVVLGALLGLLALAGGALAFGVHRLESNVEREPVFEALEQQTTGPARPAPESEPTGPLDLLVLASDSRLDPVGQDFQGTGDEFVVGERSDTNLVVRLTAERDAAWVVSIPRDSYVTLPPCRGPEGRQLPGRQDLFANAFRDGGVPCAVRAVEQLTGVRIDHTVVVDFSGFTEMVDALGGVPVCLEEPFRPRRVNISLPAGRHVLDGREALEYVRARYGIDDGSDLSRIERQKEFMASMLDRALSRDLLVRPDRLVRFLSAATSSLRVDEGLDLRSLALSLRDLEGEDVVFSTIPLDPAPGPEYARGGDLFGRVAIDEEAAAALFADLKADRLPLDAPPAPGGVPAAPEAPVDPDATTAASPCA